MSKFRVIPPAAPPITAAEFVNQAGAGRGQPTPVTPPPELSPRVMKQVNIDMPETLHWELQQLVKSMPDMSMRKFILHAISVEMARVRAGQGA